jgi:NADH:ubiquinone oxidoreductase subunit E
LRAARRLLDVNVFETSADDAIRLEPFRCFGQCAMAPNILIDGQIRGSMSGERFALLLAMLRRDRPAT